MEETVTDPVTLAAYKYRCERSHLDFTRYFFKSRQNQKFIVNWHHRMICDAIQKVMAGEIENLVINVSPGSSKTELVVINLIARGLALNPYARFLHLSYSDDLASLNSHMARELVQSDEYQMFWPIKLADDSKSKKRWNVMVNGKIAGGVYATSMAGQVTGFRAGHMREGFQGAILIDDAMRPEDAFSEVKTNASNRKLITTIKSRKANPKTPIILIMQRISQRDATAFIESGNVPGKWTFLKLPALIDDAFVADKIPPKYHKLIDRSDRDPAGRFSFWPYKEPLKDLLDMEAGKGSDVDGSRVSKHVFNAQWNQNPIQLGGNIIKGSHFKRWEILPTIKARKIFADTAQKTSERNDYSVFACYGISADNNLFLIDLIRGRWEAPELERRAKEFWNKHRAYDTNVWGTLRELVVEDKSSGTGLIQSIRLTGGIPVKGLERNKDKFTRSQDALPYIESGLVSVPANAAFTADFVAECEAFTADDTHDFDDQVDTLFDAVEDMLSSGNAMSVWRKLANG